MLRSIAVTVLGTAGSAVLAPGCADNNSSLFITAVLYRKPPQCVVIADQTQETLGGGVLDLSFTKSYVAALLVGNQLTSRGSKQTLRTETSRVTLNGAEITLTDSQGHEIARYSVNGTGFVDVSRGEDSGFGIFDAELIPASMGTKLDTAMTMTKMGIANPSLQTSDQVVARVRVFGSTLGNEDVTSSELSFPITYCQGCLVDFPLAAIDPTSNTCDVAPTDLPVGGCRVGQDDPIDCRVCASTMDLCNKVPPATTP
jgi:hypothetical protein